MSLTLQESCTKFDRYCRRHSDTPSFAEFNAKHSTCLPESADGTHAEYKRVLVAARRATGIPVTRRLPSLYKKLVTAGEVRDAAPLLQTTSRPAQSPAPRPAQSPAPRIAQSLAPRIRSMKMNIRAPNCIGTVQKEDAPLLGIQPAPKWTVEEYKAGLVGNKSILLKETGGRMVHLIPETKGGSFESLACKLTKSTWETLRGKSSEPLKMRDGSQLSVANVSFDEGDLAQFVNQRMKKVPGPHFIRFRVFK